MRAEIQNTVEQIEKSLKLLAQRLNWETAQHRLEEFNARVEDPNLWDDPAAAQKLIGKAGGVEAVKKASQNPNIGTASVGGVTADQIRNVFFGEEEE